MNIKDILLQLAIGESVTKGTGGAVKADGTGLSKDVTAIINAVIGILGLVCVVVIIIGGVNYMTSSGDAGKVKKGKDTILYGAIGLIICALAFAIVNWVIGGILQAK